MTGRPPKSIEQHLAQGTYRPDRHGDRLYERAEGSIGEPPETLPEAAQWIWLVTVEQLYKTLGASDRPLLEGFCRWMYEAARLLEDAEHCGDPLDRIKILNGAGTAHNTAMKLATKLGATPIDRQRLKGDPHSGEIDPLEALRQEE